MARRREEHKAIDASREQPLKLLSNQSMVAGGTIAGKCVFRKSDEAPLRIVAPQQFGGRPAWRHRRRRPLSRIRCRRLDLFERVQN
jgi:hypothetical protein